MRSRPVHRWLEFPWLERSSELLGHYQRLLPALGLLTIACTSPRPPEPQWAAEPPPAYPASGQTAGRTEPEETASGQPTERQAKSPTSPLASTYGGRPALQTFSGKASYYADSLAGNRTASGERYDPKLHSAAHRGLPFGTVVRVTRPDTGAVTYARVNDRGPFGGRGRVIDLSRAAAEELDMLRAGVATVRVEVVERPQ